MQAENGNHAIRYIVISSGAVSTLAGFPGHAGFADGFGLGAMFNSPDGIAMDAAGTFAIVVSIYVY